MSRAALAYLNELIYLIILMSKKCLPPPFKTTYASRTFYAFFRRSNYFLDFLALLALPAHVSPTLINYRRVCLQLIKIETSLVLFF